MRTITDEMIKAFKNKLETEEKSKNTIEKYMRDICAFKEYTDNKSLPLEGKVSAYGRRMRCRLPQQPLKEITKFTVSEYKTELMKKYTPASVNSIISSLNSFFEFNEWYDCKIKTLKIQRKIFTSSEKELTKSEYERLLCAAKKKKNQRLYYLMQTICSTGIRVSELQHITAEAINSGRAIINCKGKMRQVFLPKQLCKMLKGYIKENKITSGAVFVSKSGRPLDRSNIWSDMKKLCESAGVAKTKVFPHNLRHLFARTYYSIQKDIVRLADLLGHSSINTTRIYTMESGEVHRRQIEKLGLLRC